MNFADTLFGTRPLIAAADVGSARRVAGETTDRPVIERAPSNLCQSHAS